MSELIASPERRMSASVGGSNPTEPWSVEQDADSLMDDLFADLERLIEGGTQLPRETVAVESAPLPDLAMPDLAPLALLEKKAPSVEEHPQVPRALPEAPRQEPVIPPPPPVVPPRRRGSMQHLDKILFGVACMALLGAIAWLFNQGKLNLPSMAWPNWRAPRVEPLPPQSEVGPVSEADAQFANYMLRSLDLIDRKAAGSEPASNVMPSVLPPTPGMPNPSGTTSRSLESIPLPLYPNVPGTASSLLPPSVLEPPVPQTAPRNAAPAPKSSAPPKIASPSQTASSVTPSPPKPVAAAPQTAVASRQLAATPAPRAAAPPLKPIPVPTTLPSFPAFSPASPSATSATVSPPPSPEPPIGKYSLVGLIVSSDGSSAALFNLNGVAQRVRAGEAIGDSGWTLYSAGNQSALMRRNGEVREIYVGQKF